MFCRDEWYQWKSSNSVLRKLNLTVRLHLSVKQSMVGEMFACEKHKYKLLLFVQEILKTQKYIFGFLWKLSIQLYPIKCLNSIVLHGWYFFWEIKLKCNLVDEPNCLNVQLQQSVISVIILRILVINNVSCSIFAYAALKLVYKPTLSCVC